MRITNIVECPYCDGRCEVFDRSQVHSQSPEPPMSTCPVCNGVGKVDADDVDNIDCDKSVADYRRDYEEEASLRRWESKRDK